MTPTDSNLLSGETPVVIRRGRREDETYIRQFTRHTFAWGDYVGDAFAKWLDEPGEVLVAEFAGRPVGVTHVVYLSPDEAWFEGIRVHPEFRRKGIGVLLSRASIETSRARGCRVARCVIDSENTASCQLARRLGFQLVSRIVHLKKVVPEDLAVCDRKERRLTDKGERATGVTVRKAGHEDLETVWCKARKEMTFIGWDFRWRVLSRESVRAAVSSGEMVVAVDLSGDVVGGGFVPEPWGEKDESGAPRLIVEVSSLFGSEVGVRAVLEYAAGILRERAETGLSRGIESLCEAQKPVLEVLESLGFRRNGVEAAGSGRQEDDASQVPYDIGLWELRL